MEAASFNDVLLVVRVMTALSCLGRRTELKGPPSSMLPSLILSSTHHMQQHDVMNIICCQLQGSAPPNSGRHPGTAGGLRIMYKSPVSLSRTQVSTQRLLRESVESLGGAAWDAANGWWEWLADERCLVQSQPSSVPNLSTPLAPIPESGAPSADVRASSGGSTGESLSGAAAVDDSAQAQLLVPPSTYKALVALMHQVGAFLIGPDNWSAVMASQKKRVLATDGGAGSL